MGETKIAEFKPVLNAAEHYSTCKKESVTTLADALAHLPAGKYKAVVYLDNEMRMGYFSDGEFLFADGKNFSECYLQQLRMFNEDVELWVMKRDEDLAVRLIEDNVKGSSIKTVDSKSVLFGERVDVELPEGFVQLTERGRKISMAIPVEELATRYTLTTRSYITYDKETGQAGYGYYRWVRLAPLE